MIETETVEWFTAPGFFVVLGEFDILEEGLNVGSFVFLDDLCKPLNCKKKELCLLEDAYTAVCVSKKELHKNKWVFFETQFWW